MDITIDCGDPPALASSCEKYPQTSCTTTLQGVKVTVLGGGIGGARFIQGVQYFLSLSAQWQDNVAGDDPDAESYASFGPPTATNNITAIVNVGDDAWMHGLRISPDLDSCMYALAGVNDTERGWGMAEETFNCLEELRKYKVQPDWFSLGDRDIATHLIRTMMLNNNFSLSDTTSALATRWNLGAQLLPVTDDRCETHVVIDDPDTSQRTAIHFQQWWVKHRAEVPAHSFAYVGSEKATISPFVRSAIESADVILIAPSNPVVSVGSMLAVGGLRSALKSTSAPVIGFSPVIADAPLRGMASQCLQAINVECSAQGIGRWYGAKSGSGILDAWVTDPLDRCSIDQVTTVPTPILMSSPRATAKFIATACEAVGVG